MIPSSGGGNGWVNDSALLSALHTMGIHGGTGAMMTQQEMTFPAEVHAPTSGAAQKLHMALMGGNPTLQNTGVRGNGLGGTTRPAAAPPEETAAG